MGFLFVVVVVYFFKYWLNLTNAPLKQLSNIFRIIQNHTCRHKCVSPIRTNIQTLLFISFFLFCGFLVWSGVTAESQYCFYYYTVSCPFHAVPIGKSKRTLDWRHIRLIKSAISYFYPLYLRLKVKVKFIFFQDHILFLKNIPDSHI